MLASYYDRSEGQAKGGSLYVVAGYISHVSRWVDFDTAWKLHLAHYNVPYFHMKEFAHSRGVFPENEWKGKHRKRREFLEGLVDIIQRHAFAGFAVGVHREDFDKFAEPMAKSNSMRSAYGFCGLNCARKALTWALKERWTPRIESFFESGDKGKGQLETLFKWDGQPAPVFKPKIPRTPAEALDVLTPFQAADFAAYEVMSAGRFLADGKGDWTEVRASCLALERRPTCYWFIATAKDLDTYGDQLADAARRAKQERPGDVFL